MSRSPSIARPGSNPRGSPRSSPCARARLGPVRPGPAGGTRSSPQAPAGRRGGVRAAPEHQPPADWQRLRELFTPGAVGGQDDVWDLHAPGLPQARTVPDSGVDFVLRSGLNFTVAPEATWRPLPNDGDGVHRRLECLPASTRCSAASASGERRWGDEPVPPAGAQQIPHRPACLVGRPRRLAGRLAGTGRGDRAARSSRRVWQVCHAHAGRDRRSGAVQRGCRDLGSAIRAGEHAPAHWRVPPHQLGELIGPYSKR